MIGEIKAIAANEIIFVCAINNGKADRSFLATGKGPLNIASVMEEIADGPHHLPLWTMLQWFEDEAPVRLGKAHLFQSTNKIAVFRHDTTTQFCCHWVCYRMTTMAHW
jgi:hypothetical protein